MIALMVSLVFSHAGLEWNRGGNLRLPRVLLVQPARAQRLGDREAAARVYAQMPDLPLENHYELRETGDVATENTLASRFIRYHLYVRGRSPVYRFDWKLTLADYLGANEWVQPSIYPGADNLQDNPQAGDIAAISSLNRSQRDQLVQILVEVYGDNASASPAGE